MDRLKLYFSVFVLFISIVSASSSYGNYGVTPHVSKPKVLSPKDNFSLFKRQFGKVYASVEEQDYRFSVFKANLRRARRHQKLDPLASHGVTQFSDLTPSEFKKTHSRLKAESKLPKFGNMASILPIENLPAEFDWRDRGAVTPVKDQGFCGSCYAFSAVAALEGANFLANGKLFNLSEQQLMDCDHGCDRKTGICNAGCDGGLMNPAYEYYMHRGAMKEEDYPYTGKNSPTCKLETSKSIVFVSNYSDISNDEDQITANLVKNGPLAAGINSDYLQTYIGGVSCPYICSKRLDHAVSLVGYGSAGFAPDRLQEKPYWIIKNSWGETWGENGYYKLCKGGNICGIDSRVSTVSVSIKRHRY